MDVSDGRSGVFWDLNAFLESFPVYAGYHVWSGLLRSARPVDDGASVCGGLCGDLGRGLVRRLFQQVRIYDLPSFALLTNPSRGLHSAVFSFIGAIGFLASAVLPADAFQVRVVSESKLIRESHLMPSSLGTAASSSQLAVHLPASPHYLAGSPQTSALRQVLD